MKLVKKILGSEGLLLFLLVAIVAFSYIKVLNGFFQQDEWYGFGWYFLHKSMTATESVKFFFTPSVGHYNPLTLAFQQLLFSLWGPDYIKFAVLGVILHLGVVTAVYYFSKILFKGNRLLSFTTALLFGILASTYQGVAWVTVNISTLGAALTGLVSSIFFFTFLGKRRSRYLIWSLVFLIISLFFKETTIGLFPLFFIILLRRNKWKLQRDHILIAGFGMSYVLARLAMLLAPNLGGDKLVSQSQSVYNIFYNFLTLPPKALSQALLSSDLLKGISFILTSVLPESIRGVFGSPEFEAFAVLKVMEMLSLIIGFGVIVYVAKKFTGDYETVFLGLVWTGVNSLIFSLAPETSQTITAIDSRNLYFSSIGLAILVISVVHHAVKGNLSKFILIVIPLIIFNLFLLNRELSHFVEVGVIRKSILERITGQYPDLPRKTIFYTISDISYYGLPKEEKILPFQSGFGQALLVWYYPRENIPDSFFENRFLWEIQDQGYREFDGWGFGYFRNYELLIRTVREYNLESNSVIAFSWDHNTGSLADMTSEVRKQLDEEINR